MNARRVRYSAGGEGRPLGTGLQRGVASGIKVHDLDSSTSWNVETCRSDPKGKIQVEAPRERES